MSISIFTFGFYIGDCSGNNDYEYLMHNFYIKIFNEKTWVNAPQNKNLMSSSSLKGVT